ncbi:DUF3224 domain-containing protein [Streptomyces sp. NPDC001978]|uniref:DUF3224 domain-containing protein n=1 Tax=Streptomyces sp. NPDC001978 TaxID=3364627 RepID=UPI0036833E2F
MSVQQSNSGWRLWGKASGATALSLAICALVATPSSASSNQVLGHFYDTGTVTPSEKIVCASGGTAIHGSATFKAKPGDRWHGTTSYDYCLYPESTPGSYSYSGTETLTGTVDGCGKGSFTYFGKGETASGGTWKIIRGSGTGRLTHASGSGTDTATTDPTTLENWGVFQGQFTC